MRTIYLNFGAIILCSIISLAVQKPFGDDKPFGDAKLHCAEAHEGFDYEGANPNSYKEFYKPRARFEGLEKYSSGPFEYNKKRSSLDDLDTFSNPLQKRQVGVVYKDSRPMGILQPYQRSYRFIPVKEENSYGLDTNQPQEISDNLPSGADIGKREINVDSGQDLEESYPSILTNFKIFNKLDKKRNYDALTDDNVRDLKATIRKLRSSDPHNSEQIEEELKNILDDMGLIDDDEMHPEKRETGEDQKDDEDEAIDEDEVKPSKERSKRGELCNENADSSNKLGVTNERVQTDENKSETKGSENRVTMEKRDVAEESSDTSRETRQKQETPLGSNKENLNVFENSKNLGEPMVNGDKSPLTSSSELTVRDTESKQSEKKPYEEDESDYDKRVERQIQNKINSLKEEVKREIEALKKNQNDDDSLRQKRQVAETLLDEESDEVNPVINTDGELKPLIRKRRTINHAPLNNPKNNIRRKRDTSFAKRKKRGEHSSNLHDGQKKYKSRQDEGDEGGDILGGDDFENPVISKRQIFNNDPEYADIENEDRHVNNAVYLRKKRSRALPTFDVYNDYDHLYNENIERLKRQNSGDAQEINSGNRFIPRRSSQLRSRFRRRIKEELPFVNRPQQLSDMSDLDLFGALPKSYNNGELSRYKRVK